MTTAALLVTYALGIGGGWVWGALWAARFVLRRAGVHPYQLKRQDEITP